MSWWSRKYRNKDTDRNKEGELLVSPNGLKYQILESKMNFGGKLLEQKALKNFLVIGRVIRQAVVRLDLNGEPLVMYRGLRTPIEVKDFYNSDFTKINLQVHIPVFIHTPLQKSSIEIYAGEGGKFCLLLILENLPL